VGCGVRFRCLGRCVSLGARSGFFVLI
jgi:hypothetical protein